MTDNSQDLPTLPDDLPALAVLGLTDPETGDWARLRGLQYSYLARVSTTRVATHFIAAALVVLIYFGQVSVVVQFGWLAALAVAVYSAIRYDKGLGDADKRRMTRVEFNKQAISQSLIALVWSAPMLLFMPYGTQGEQMALWAIAAMLVTSAALRLSAAPLGTVTFAMITGLTAVGVFCWQGAYDLAATVVVFVVLSILGTIEGARNYLKARIAEAGVVEKSEVVSLLLREFEENEADWLWQVDTARRIRSVSPRFAFALGRTTDEIDGLPFLQLISGDAWETGQFSTSLHDLAERLKRRENFSNLIVKVSISGATRWWELSGTPMLDERGAYLGFRGVGSDVTEQRESSEKIAYLARYDTLTGLPNRLMLNEALGEAMRYSKQWRSRCAFLMIDLDRFKAVNDSLGHLVGDQLLAQVSGRLKGLLGTNEMCGRLGGDEFAIVIRDADKKGHVQTVADAIISELSRPYDIEGNTLFVGASVGSAVGPRDGGTVEELMRNADLALYRAKDNGGSEHYCYEPALHASAEERRKLEFSLRRALENEELDLAFQPVVDANSEAIVSFEALVRWNSKEHGFVSPAKFIPLAEDTRLIVPIGTWVMERACREAVNWPTHVRIAVNVSPEQLVEPAFADTVVNALRRSGLEAHRLEVEVTESIFLRDANLARAALEQVMALGCTVALDDFGTGYSSLGYLRKLKFSTIKVDRSFVQGAAQNSAESLAIIRAVVAMADSLEMATTAEGVETAEEAEMIRKMGCTKIQGYHFGRPMSASDARQLFVRQARLRA
ncbi:putative bifunctional diguanylate cyclase/phosphodiesterase [Alteripontixanthobacter muriae]|uniref:putative bifunctional diguanylate cyclase/phosphodiesterase n=1 Tax=Alteripontixanthobacter muriae TaxID=2705546 RepID=UPI002FC2E8EB